MANRRDSGEQVPGIGDVWDPVAHIPDPVGSLAPTGERTDDERTDDELYADVCRAIERSPEIEPSGIEVMVTGGEVFLTGLVADRDQKRRAEQVVRQVGGVREVFDRLELLPTPAGPSHGDVSYG